MSQIGHFDLEDKYLVVTLANGSRAYFPIQPHAEIPSFITTTNNSIAGGWERVVVTGTGQTVSVTSGAPRALYASKPAGFQSPTTSGPPNMFILDPTDIVPGSFWANGFFTANEIAAEDLGGDSMATSRMLKELEIVMNNGKEIQLPDPDATSAHAELDRAYRTRKHSILKPVVGGKHYFIPTENAAWWSIGDVVIEEVEIPCNAHDPCRPDGVSCYRIEPDVN